MLVFGFSPLGFSDAQPIPTLGPEIESATITFTGGEARIGSGSAGTSVAITFAGGTASVGLVALPTAANIVFSSGASVVASRIAPDAGAITFSGGDGAVGLAVSGGVSASITFTGGTPVLASGAAHTAATIAFTGGDANAGLAAQGTAASIAFSGGTSSPGLLVRVPSATIWFSGGVVAEQFEAAQGTVVVLNAQTLAVTEYSLSALDVVEHEGEVWFVTATGLSKLDSAAPLDFVSSIRTGKLNFVPGSVTGARFAHASIASTGPVELLSHRDDDGIERTDRYPIPIVPSGQPRERTIPLGKGAQASAWDFEIRASTATTQWSLGGLQIQVPLKKHRL